MRTVLTRLHRWLGLGTAVFLFVAGVSGALIAWDHELDAWLNPQFYRSESGLPPVSSPLDLADRFEAGEPRARVTFIEELDPTAGDVVVLWVEPTVDAATGEPHELDYDHVALDPATGLEQGRRLWGRISLSRQDVLSFLYKLHFTLHIPDIGDFETGVFLMGIVAVVWLVDGVVALVISFPNPRRWTRSFVFRVREGGVRLLFDVHRSGGVWVWPLLILLAITAVSLNLHDEVARPLVSLVSPLTPDPFAALEERPPERPYEPALGRREVLALARAEAQRRGWSDPPGGMFWSPSHGVYGVGFHPPGGAHADGTLGNPWVYFDGATGAVSGHDVPGTGSAGDLFLQLQFPLHSGRIGGVPGRLLVSLLGVVVAALSATGVALWARREILRRRAVLR